LQAKSKKIIIGGMTKVLECVYDDGECLAGKSTIIILPNGNVNMKYILGILNSKFISFWYKAFYSSLSLAGGYLRIGSNEIKNIPLLMTTETEQNRIAKLVDLILTAKNRFAQANTTELERDIDLYVYKVYGLTDQEIAVVERDKV
jgi:hypothetical protein